MKEEKTIKKKSDKLFSYNSNAWLTVRFQSKVMQSRLVMFSNGKWVWISTSS